MLGQKQKVSIEVGNNEINRDDIQITQPNWMKFGLRSKSKEVMKFELESRTNTEKNLVMNQSVKSKAEKAKTKHRF